MVSLPGRTGDYLETPRNASFSCLLLANSPTLTVFILSTAQIIPSSGVLFSTSVSALSDLLQLWSYTKNVFSVYFAPKAVHCCLCCPKVLLLSCSSQPKLGARRMVNPLAFCDLSILSALSMPLQTAGPQKLEQPWRLADFFYRVLGHAQHQVCTASILVEKNLNHSFLEVVRCFSQVQRWPKSHKALLVPIR